MPHYDSSDDEPVPVFVFDETSFGIRRKDPAALASKKKFSKDDKIDLDTTSITEAGKKANMDVDE
jgi:hypothetical protein